MATGQSCMQLALTAEEVIIYEQKTNSTVLSVSNTLTAGSWHHWAVCRSSGTLYLAWDGAIIGSVANTTDWITAGANWVWGINGYSKAAQNYGLWYLDACSIVNYARYTADFTPPASDTVAQVYRQASPVICDMWFGDTVGANQPTTTTFKNIGTRPLTYIAQEWQ